MLCDSVTCSVEVSLMILLSQPILSQSKTKEAWFRRSCRLSVRRSGSSSASSSSRGCMHSPFFWRRNPTKTLVFLLPWISPWFFVGFSAFSPTLCTVVSKKTKLSCFGGFFSLVFKIQATAWFSLSCLHDETRTKEKYTFKKYYQS